MILAWLVIIPLAGGILAWLLEGTDPRRPRWIALATLTVDLGIGLSLAARRPVPAGLLEAGSWLERLDIAWIPRFGIRIHLAMDGLSLLLVLLTIVLGIAAVVSSWTEIRDRVGFFHFNLLWITAGITGVFLALDLFLFYFFWEMMLIPMYLLIAVWGHENRVYAALKFFIFTQASGLLMLASILALAFIHFRIAGFLSFDYLDLLGLTLEPGTATWIMLGFFIAFTVKLPAVPFHTWLADAHTEAPTGGSVILAGLLLKTGAYGLLRFAVPLFPDAAQALAPAAMVLGVAGILYGAVLAFAQDDLKRLVAYTSVSHLGFVLLGIYAWNELALQGAVMQMLAHGLSTGGLFILVGALQERTHTRDLTRLGGLWATVPRMGGLWLFFALASLGLPGLGNFVAEFLVLTGSFRVSVPLTVVATVGLVAATIYALSMVQRAFHGPNVEGWILPDLSARDMALLLVMAALLLWMGLFPQAVFEAAAPALDSISGHAAGLLAISGGRP
jgi:NADH-quinone oxidoreductase subunit M